ncbi:MAG: LamG domain-containing protein [Verrucomicrobia bacterium]|nr:LamG domain-containing protein [Verrucomicrobiota bacterium]MDA1086393.1 LamG domain-containing protein [Verrucomicrobiota bacterium]
MQNCSNLRSYTWFGYAAALSMVGCICISPLDATGGDPTLRDLRRAYKDHSRQIEKDHGQGVSDANAQYLEILEELAKQMALHGTASDAAIASVRAECDRFRASPALPDSVVSRRPRSLGLRQRKHLDNLEELRRERARKIVRLADAYLERLAQFARQQARDTKAQTENSVQAEMTRIEQSATVSNARKMLDRPAATAASGRKTVNLPPALAKRLVLHFSFDLPSVSRIPDTSGNNHFGIPSGARRVGDGRVASGCTFDGRMSSIQIAPSEKLSPAAGFSIAVWACPASRSRNPAMLVERDADRGFSLSLSAFDPRLIYTWSPGEGRAQRTVETEDPIPFGDWSHIAVAHDRSGVQLYVNGARRAQLDGATPLAAIDDQRIVIGAKLSSHRPRDHFEGKLDEFMVFNRALTDEEAIALYRSAGGDAAQ